MNLKMMNEKRKCIPTPGLFKNDGTHLTLIGNAIFLNTFKEALNIFLTDNTQTVYDANL